MPSPSLSPLLTNIDLFALPSPPQLLLAAGAGLAITLLVLFLWPEDKNLPGLRTTLYPTWKYYFDLHPLEASWLSYENLNRVLDIAVEAAAFYGGEKGLGTWFFKVPFQPRFVVANDPKNIEHVLTKPDVYGKGPVWRRK